MLRAWHQLRISVEVGFGLHISVVDVVGWLCMSLDEPHADSMLMTLLHFVGVVTYSMIALKVYSVVFGPEDLGWWVNRKRRLSVMVLREAGFLAATMDTFEKMFFKHRPSSSPKGHMFFCAPPKVAVNVLERLSAENGLSGHGKLEWKRVIPPGDARRLEACERGYQDFMDSVLVKSNISEDDCMFLDDDERLKDLQFSLMCMPIINVAQAFDKKGGTAVSGNQVPTLMTSSALYSLFLERPMLGPEYLACQGIPAFHEENGLFCKPCFTPSAFSDADLKFLAGNAIHCACAGALTAFALAYFVRREPDQLPASMSNHTADSDPMDEDL
jgi:hypothetical protein